MELKGCPLLVQGETWPSMTVAGKSTTTTYMLHCVGEQCAAFDWKGPSAYCKKFGSFLEVKINVPEEPA